MAIIIVVSLSDWSLEMKGVLLKLTNYQQLYTNNVKF